MDPGFLDTFNRHMSLTRAAPLGISGMETGFRSFALRDFTGSQPCAGVSHAQLNVYATPLSAAADRTTQLMWRFSDGELPLGNIPKVG